ncbi:chromosome segregation protein [Carpediemonas membranifera]|uniref:Chromosome segregation protein n=1 Tax=Carpediemonas membranifera TaxID=201153 RepID=A0A8J6AWY3_9EUKA|nr:chromosome segregation protein [Carpediemonas membranifera]|eukprot:KAG9394565.1 chromosome segregation protein [Carpediemonas membranifera]
MSNQPVIDDLKQRLEAATDAKRSTFSDLEAERRDQKRQLADVTSEVVSLTKEKEFLAKRKAELEEDNVAFSKRNADLEATLTATEQKMMAQVQALERAGAAVEREKVAVDQKIKIVDAKIREVEQQKADIADALRLAIEERGHFKAQGDMEAKKNAAVEQQIGIFTGRVADLKTKLDEEKTARAKTIADGAAKQKQLEEEVLALKATLGEVQHKADVAAQRFKVLTASNSQLKNQKSELETVTHSLRNKVKNLDREVRDLSKYYDRQATRSPALKASLENAAVNTPSIREPKE